MTNSPVTLKVQAHGGPDGMAFEATQYFMTIAEADAVAALFPKYVKVLRYHEIRGNWIAGTTQTASILNRAEYDASEFTSRGYFNLTLRFISNGVTGEANESAVKRYRAFRRVCDQHGIELEYTTPYANSIADLATFESALEG